MMLFSMPHHHAPALPRTRSARILPSRRGREDDLVAVLQERARFARRQLMGLLPPSVISERAQSLARLAGNRARAENVARRQVAAAHRVMRHHLRRRPVEVLRRSERQAMRRHVLCAHLFGRDQHFELQRQPAFLLVARVGQMGQRLGIADPRSMTAQRNMPAPPA